MSDSIALPKTLETRLLKAAAKAHASPKQLACKAIAAHLDHLDWLDKVIHDGFRIRRGGRVEIHG